MKNGKKGTHATFMRSKSVFFHTACKSDKRDMGFDTALGNTADDFSHQGLCIDFAFSCDDKINLFYFCIKIDTIQNDVDT